MDKKHLVACVIAFAAGLVACGNRSPSASTASSDLSGADVGGTSPGGYLLYEKFNEMESNAPPSDPWVTAGSALVQEVPFAADKSVALTTQTSSDRASLSMTLPEESGRVVFEAKVLARETAGFKAIPYIYDSGGNAVASVAFQDGAIQIHIGGTITTVQSFVANVWYRVRVVVDTSRGTFDLYIDGVRVEQGQALRSAAASVASVGYYVDSGPGTLLVDNLKVYNEATFIGSPPAPVFDVRTYGAAGDGTTNDGVAIQAAIAAAAGTGGSVLLSDGTYLSGTLTLASNLTFFIDATATLRASTDAADYPPQKPATGNTQLSNTQRALLYAPGVTQLAIDGGGTIDGQGDSFASGAEATRPLLVWAVLSQNVHVHNVYLTKGAVWSLVSMESDHVLIDNINLQSNGITHDGIDIVDGADVTVDDCAVSSGDDAMSPKSGVRRGIDTLTITNSIFSGNGTSGGSNGIKFGTATYGAFTNVSIQDDYVKNVQYAAMALESRQGSDVSGVAFQRIEFANVGSAFFVYLAQQNTTHPIGDTPKLGSIDQVSFADISGATASWAHSPHQGALVTGNIFEGVTYPITNLTFENVAITFDGGLTAVPASPPEATPNEYPESNMFGDLPAWGYYLRHVSGVGFANCTTAVATPDARQELVTDDVSGLVGSP